MKSPVVAALFVAGLVICSAQEQGPRREGEIGMNFMRFNPLLAAIDTDHDGVLSADEIKNSAVALRKLDKNGDGKLTQDEMRPAFGPGGRDPGRPEGRGPDGAGGGGKRSSEMVDTLMSFDKDGDGKLSKEEVPERMQGLFARGDANSDGFLTREELTKMAESQAGSTSPQQGREEGRDRRLGLLRRDPITAAFDTDNDGVLSAAEIDAAPAALAKLDKNADGKISEDEVRPNFGPGVGFQRERRRQQ